MIVIVYIPKPHQMVIEDKHHFVNMFCGNTSRFRTTIMYTLVLPCKVINPQCACAARVTVGVCVCVSTLNLSPHTLKSQKRDTNGFIAIHEPF